jgi:hypothetical protein
MLTELHCSTIWSAVCVVQTNQLVLYTEIIAVCSQVHTKHTNTIYGQNVELLNVEPCFYTYIGANEISAVRLKELMYPCIYFYITFLKILFTPINFEPLTQYNVCCYRNF